MRKFVRVLVTAAAVGTLAVAVQSTAAAAPVRPAASDEVLAAMQRDLGLTAAQAATLRGQQDRAVDLDVRLRSSLGADFGGSWFDAAAGRLTVAVTDQARVAEVTKAGAAAKVVRHSAAELDAVRAELDTLSGKASGDGRAKQGVSKLRGLASWRVDQKTNSVVVTAVKGQQASLSALAKFGDAVRVEQTDRAPVRTANYLDGGDAINYGSCSAGFNLRNQNTGQGFLLTAGHCVGAGSTVYGQDGVVLGTTVASFFPSYDDALVRNDNPSYWYQGWWVDTNPSNGGIITVSGHSDAPVGTYLCKSGITTKWTCGYITGKDETVNYSQGAVYGMTRHSACVEPGDSGGANVAALSHWSPEGVTSGAQLYWDGSRYRCAAAVGAGQNVSWYFPIADSLAYYGPAYGVTMW
ncbi:S1 family peptidase [Actinophytocola algeriensis]|uniref:Streptogrisin C n=1 Tax=Actinophytocola algeriensis TaxID=1768010 RepID=A0A7W7QBA6_9PSEU|nr:S1 family peptidase [Actinophytocola algeriensis]MBB4910001.1 streptogrisin C [Actinophytocola algeriensis]MBE1475991.1 streptogrisin C [Actinophytocola algeriensis]